MVRFNDKKQATELSPEDILIMTDVSDSDSDKKVTMNQMATYVAGIVPSNLPSQSGHAGQYLKTDGTEPSWADVQSLPSQTGQAGKYLYSDGTDATWRSSYRPPLLSCMWADHQLNDIQWLRGDTFSWQDGILYSAVYNLLLEALGTKVQMYCWSNADDSHWFWTLSETPQAGDRLYGWGDEYVTCDVGTVNNVVDNNTIYLTTVLNPNDGSVVTLNTNFTRNSSKDKQSYTCHFERFNGITVYVNQRPNGLKIAMPNQEQAILNLYNTTGVAWYYILDTTNTRFKLPRMKYLASVNSKQAPIVAGTELTSLGNPLQFGTSGSTSTKWYNIVQKPATSDVRLAELLSGESVKPVAIDQSNLYADVANAVTPQTLDNMYLYFYVGDYTQDAIEQTAGLNAELFNGKVDLNFNNMNPSQTAKNTIVEWGMPDYSGQISLSTGTTEQTYTAPSNGFIGYNFLMSGNNTGYVKVNDITVITNRPAGSNIHDFVSGIIPVNKNDVIKYWSSGTSEPYNNFQFYPMKGAN